MENLLLKWKLIKENGVESPNTISNSRLDKSNNKQKETSLNEKNDIDNNNEILDTKLKFHSQF